MVGVGIEPTSLALQASASSISYQVAEEREVVIVGAGLVPARRALSALFKMSNTCVATGRDEPCPYNLSLSCNLVSAIRPGAAFSFQFSVFRKRHLAFI
jgi:hypothetical protein